MQNLPPMRLRIDEVDNQPAQSGQNQEKPDNESDECKINLPPHRSYIWRKSTHKGSTAKNVWRCIYSSESFHLLLSQRTTHPLRCSDKPCELRRGVVCLQ